MLSPTAPPPRANAGIRRSRTESTPQLVMRLPAAPAAALVIVLLMRRLPNSFRRAWRGFRRRSDACCQAPVRPVNVTAKSGVPAPSRGGKSAFPARQSIQKRHRRRSEPISQVYRRHETLQSQSACPSPPQAARRRKRQPPRPPGPPLSSPATRHRAHCSASKTTGPAWLRPCVAPVRCRRASPRLCTCIRAPAFSGEQSSSAAAGCRKGVRSFDSVQAVLDGWRTDR